MVKIKKYIFQFKLPGNKKKIENSKLRMLR